VVLDETEKRKTMLLDNYKRGKIERKGKKGKRRAEEEEEREKLDKICYIKY
jgi:hypothetical protein